MTTKHFKLPHYEALCKYSSYPIDIIGIIIDFAGEEILVVVNKGQSKFGIFDSQFEYEKSKSLFGISDNYIQRITVDYGDPKEYSLHAAGHTIIRRTKYNNIYTNGWLSNISHATYNKPDIQPKYEGHTVVQTIPNSYHINKVYYLSTLNSDKFR